VQRTGLLELFKNDLQNLKFAAKVFDKIDPKSDGADRDWVSIYEESAKLLYREISYKQEAEAAKRFQKQFADKEWIKVPDMYDDYITDKVLTMEYCPSTKISDVEKIQELGLDRAKLAERSAISYLEQLSNHGFFHCDPHPGNIGVDSGAPGGRLVYYDFGMMDEISGDLKDGLVDLILGIYDYDSTQKDTTKAVCRAAERMGILDPQADMVPIEKITRFFLNDFANTQKGQRQWTKDKTKDQQKEERAARRSVLGESLLSVGSDVPFKFPPTFTFVFRAFTSSTASARASTPTMTSPSSRCLTSASSPSSSTGPSQRLSPSTLPRGPGLTRRTFSRLFSRRATWLTCPTLSRGWRGGNSRCASAPSRPSRGSSASSTSRQT